MSYQSLGNAIKDVVKFLNDSKIDHALIGGLAVSFRTIERATVDIDLIVLANSQAESEQVIRSFQAFGFSVKTLMENKKTRAISTARLLSPNYPNIYLDLLFGATGIEKEIIQASEPIELLPDLKVQVASLSSLIAMKVLSSNNKDRVQDLLDLQNLIKEAESNELLEAHHLIKLIQDRGFNSGIDLFEKFEKLKSQFLETK